MNNLLNQFKKGGIVFHKATGSKCVILEIKDKDGTVKVRTDKDLERCYFPQELKTKEELDIENKIKRDNVMEANKNRWGI